MEFGTLLNRFQRVEWNENEDIQGVPRNMKVATRLVNFNFIKIKPKSISPVILKHKKGRPHFVNAKTRGNYYLENFTSKIRFMNNIANYFKDQSLPSIRLGTIMFRETPCIGM